ncbi:tRNA lysidine(34) synthetase TilS [Methylobacterium organophilum]|uniref:tRNA(Ile)-lysidine synthase n=1 Tax=Methylobacterium organophilum TaxID=410 RepID=A0ABQ4TEF2_METOR|nr:tRNA lysidine(34) synthetase TilS [Methylobacterium organophilum]GJE28402.1 tRNA(Ile)-lysidine synthase [Methylobacterium organophilum]
MNGAAPDLDARLARALAPFLTTRTILLAVSGGPDSTALLQAAARHRGTAELHVATVDHRLRPEAAAEAAAVGRLAASLGLPHRVLVWEDPPEGGGLQAAARAARYRLLFAQAAAIGADLVLTAHTRDDQAETVLMRLLAGSGPAGLAGMAPLRAAGEGIGLGRPFLGIAKADLVAYCEAWALPFLRDPSNSDPRFGRARLRALMPALAAEGLSASRLARLAERLARDEAALGTAAAALLARAERQPAGHPLEGRLELDGAVLRGQPAAILLRLFDRALEAVASGEPDPVPRRLERLEQLVLAELLPALEDGRALRRTLRGVLVSLGPNGRIRLAQAPPRRARALAHRSNQER